MLNFTAVMKLDPSDNRVAKYMHFDTRAKADAHVAGFLAQYPDAFVQEDADDVRAVDPGCWRYDTDNRTILDRVPRPKLMREWKGAMLRTDRDMPRFLEDHIEHSHDGLADNSRQQKLYDDKRTLRGEKP